MSDHKTYTEKLKDPRWQKRRLEILKRDNWACQLCQDNKESLVVHHRYYLPNTEPWDYPSESLITLCVTCHDAEREQLPDYEQQIIRALKSKFFAQDIYILARGIEDANLIDDTILIARTFANAFRNTEAQQLLIDLFKKKA